MREAKTGLSGEDEREDERRGGKRDEAERGRVEKAGAYQHQVLAERDHVIGSALTMGAWSMDAHRGQ